MRRARSPLKAFQKKINNNDKNNETVELWPFDKNAKTAREPNSDAITTLHRR